MPITEPLAEPALASNVGRSVIGRQGYPKSCVCVLEVRARVVASQDEMTPNCTHTDDRGELVSGET